MMSPHSSWQRTRFFFALLPFLPLACASGTDVPPGSGGSEAGRGVGESGSGSAGKPNGGSAGTSKGGATATGGSSGTLGSGGIAPGTGGSVMMTGGTGGTSAGAGGSSGGSGAASGAGGSVTAGAGGTIGNGGSGAMSGAGGGNGASAGQGATGGTVSDPCASVTCGAGQTCSNGMCMCMTGTLCSGSCIDTTGDVNNCGGCGTKCDSAGACVDGKCVNPMCNPDTMQRSGHITHYSLATSMVACHYQTSELPTNYGAMNEYDWNAAAVCGACVEITNTTNNQKVTVEIVDQCPYKNNEMWCYQGSHHIDLNLNAAGAIGASNNNPAVTWKFVSCTPDAGGITYYIDAASKSDYVSVSPLNIKNPVAKMEVKKGAAFAAMPRNNSNMFEGTGGPFSGSITLRLTDIYNHVITDTVMMTPGKTVQGTAQFPACP
jgi:expansin (peptidoglycan-binding protein)